MNTKEMIKLLIDVEVDTEDLRLLKEHPKEHVATIQKEKLGNLNSSFFSWKMRKKWRNVYDK